MYEVLCREVKVVKSATHHVTAYITVGGLDLAQNSVNLKDAAYYSIECITDGGLNLALNPVNLKDAAY